MTWHASPCPLPWNGSPTEFILITPLLRSLQAADDVGITPLHIACTAGHHGIVSALLSPPPSSVIMDCHPWAFIPSDQRLGSSSDGGPPFPSCLGHVRACCNDAETLGHPLQSPGAIFSPSTGGGRRNIDPFAVDSNGNTATHVVAAAGNASLMALLLELVPRSLMTARSVIMDALAAVETSTPVVSPPAEN